MSLSKIKNFLRKFSFFKNNYHHYARVTHFLLKGHLVKYFYLKKLSRRSEPLKLQIGGNKYVITDSGWVNGDILDGDLYLNAIKPLPFRDESFDFIFAEQFIEHLDINEARQLLREANRILVKGGVIRLATPDMQKLYATYLDNNDLVSIDEAMNRHKVKHNPDVMSPGHFFNDYFRYWGHKFIFDFDTLSKVLKQAGFSEVKRYAYGESDHSELSGRERHAENYDWMKNAWQLIVEAKK